MGKKKGTRKGHTIALEYLRRIKKSTGIMLVSKYCQSKSTYNILEPFKADCMWRQQFKAHLLFL